MSSEITNEVKCLLIKNELSLWRNSAYQFELRHRVNKKLGATADELKQLEAELIKCEKAIDILQEELDNISPTTAEK